MKKHSTGKLSKQQRQVQDDRYKENHEYDYIVIGAGNASLTVSSLLAQAGKKVCILEAHDIPGGYAHTFKMGDYAFCAQVHYIWGCGEGGVINQFLKKLDLHKDITFELYDPEGYDHMVLPDKTMIKIPFGFDKLEDNIAEKYPEQRKNVKKFLGIVQRLHDEFKFLPSGNLEWTKLVLRVPKLLTCFRYLKKTLQDVFDECKLSKEVQAVLIANAGDFMSPPRELSIFAYTGLFAGYNTGAYYPTKHFKYYVERLAKFITDHEGCHIYYESKVSKVNINDNSKQVESIETEDGKVFKAKNFICNMDPQSAAKMIGWEKIPKKFRPALSYEYSPTTVMVYLGLKNIDLKKFGFGRHNVWHMAQWDMNKIWDDSFNHNFEKPWIFISTPSLHTDAPGTTPKGGHVMEIATLASYDYFKKLKDEDYKLYTKKKMELADRMLDFVQEHHIPNLREHIAVKVVGTPVTNEEFVLAPRGNSYGSLLSPKNMGFGRLNSKSPWDNFFWCNASSGYGGIYGTVLTGMGLYMALTGDKFFDSSKSLSDSEVIENLRMQISQTISEGKLSENETSA